MVENELNTRLKILEEIHDNLQSYVYTASIIFQETVDKGGSVFLFGNGRNAVNIQNFILDFDKKSGANIVSLSQDIATITTIANSFGIERIFDKQVELKVKQDDLLVGFSASGNSKNVLRALSLGRNMGCKTIGFSGRDGGAMDEFCDLNIVVPSDDLSQIYEMHLIIGDIVFHT